MSARAPGPPRASLPPTAQLGRGSAGPRARRAPPPPAPPRVTAGCPEQSPSPAVLGANLTQARDEGRAWMSRGLGGREGDLQHHRLKGPALVCVGPPDGAGGLPPGPWVSGEMAGVSRLAVRPCRPNPRLGAVDFFVGLWKGQSNAAASGAVGLDPAEGAGGCEGPGLARDGPLAGHSPRLSRFSHLRTGKKIKEGRASGTKDRARAEVNSRLLRSEPSSLQ